MTLAPPRFSSPTNLSMMSEGDPSGCGCPPPDEPEIFVTFSGGVEDGAPYWDNNEEKFYDAIGNRATVRVDSTAVLASVTWIVSGGVKNYTMTVDEAKVTPFDTFEYESVMVSGEARTFDVMFPSFDELTIIWDQSGEFTVTAHVTFVDAAFEGQSDSVSVTVEEPNVDEFKNEQQAFIFKNYYNQLFGLIHQSFDPALPGNKFSAQVDTVPHAHNKSGQFAFLQTVKEWVWTIELKNGQKPVDVTVPETILDDYGGQGSALFMKGYTSDVYQAAADNISLPDGTIPVIPIVDSPYLTAKWQNQYPDPTNNKFESQFTKKAKYDTYLMFKPDSPNGYWISIAKLSWELDGTAEWTKPNNMSPADYLNEDNWVISINKPKSPSPLPGTPNVEFVKWNGKVSDYKIN